MTYWLCLPLAPLNPIEEDTLAPLNLHFTVGVANPNGIVSLGPVMSASCEMLVVHPFMVRGTVELKYGRITSSVFPTGHLWSVLMGGDAIYYRGTDHLTGYIGAGAVFAAHSFRSFAETADSLFLSEGVTDVDIKQQWGYRIILGLRYHRSYSLEIGVVELRPRFMKVGSDGAGGEHRSYQATRTGSFQITIGYLFEV
ncbi:MAG: hypothetical protein AB1772_04080 [Candidatus Zixiibacteriota bacterium]